MPTIPHSLSGKSCHHVKSCWKYRFLVSCFLVDDNEGFLFPFEFVLNTTKRENTSITLMCKLSSSVLVNKPWVCHLEEFLILHRKNTLIANPWVLARIQLKITIVSNGNGNPKTKLQTRNGKSTNKLVSKVQDVAVILMLKKKGFQGKCKLCHLAYTNFKTVFKKSNSQKLINEWGISAVNIVKFGLIRNLWSVYHIGRTVSYYYIERGLKSVMLFAPSYYYRHALTLKLTTLRKEGGGMDSKNVLTC